MLNPLSDKVVIKYVKKESKTAFGIIIPDQATDKPDDGVVCAVGPGKYLESGVYRPTTIKVGDRVLFSKFAAQIIKVGDEQYLMMGEDNIIGVIQ